MSEYTPTTEQVRLDYVMAYSEKESSQILAERDFDRWLANVERAAAERAWLEGADSAFYNPEIRGYVDYPDENPYRREETE